MKDLFKGKTVYLRALEPEDLELIYEWENSTEFWSISNTQALYSKTVLQEYLKTAFQDIYSTKQLRMVIVDIENNKSIGTVDIFDFEPFHRRAGLGIMIYAENDRKKGFATEALKIIERYAFRVLDLHQLFCNVLENNTNSIKLFEKIGYIKIGQKKDWHKQNGDFINEIMFQKILESDE